MDKEPRSKCGSFLIYLWKISSCVFSHFMMICLVIAYCILGAFTFEKLEAANEKELKLSIPKIRGNVTHSIWRMTKDSPVLRQENWTEDVVEKLKEFEKNIVKAMKHDGWDGSEKLDSAQWTFTGSLFYSIIVITTIGYGHIAPKTLYGKVVTIFYAILGIPLMLICLSNIGDVMASSFRFLYWRVCCYMCTRPPKRRKSHRRSSSRMHSRSQSMRRRPRSQPFEQTEFLRGRSLRSSRRQSDKREIPRHDSVDRRNKKPQRYFSHPMPSHNTDYRRDMRRVKSYQAEISRMNSEYEERNDDMRTQPANESSDEVLEDLEAVFRDLKIERRCKPGDFRSKSLPRPKKKNSVEHNTKFNSYRRNLQIDRDDNEVRDLDSVDYKNYLERKSREQSKGNNSYVDDIDLEYVDHFTTNRPDEFRIKIPDTNHKTWESRPDKFNSIPRDNKNYDLRFENENSRLNSRRDFSDGDFTDRIKKPQKLRRPYSDLEFYNRGIDFDDGVDMSNQRRQFKRGFSEVNPRVRNRNMRYSDYDYRNQDDDYRMDRQRRVRSDLFEFGRGSHGDTYSKAGGDHNSRPELNTDYYSLTPERNHRNRWSNSDDEEELRTIPRARLAQEFNSRFQDSVQEFHNSQAMKPVPIWLCVLLVISYIVAGTFLFHNWEGWKFLDSAYFCFITLTTIGFGDFVPAQGVKSNSEISIALCSLYLLFGISLLAMSLNLVQEEVIGNVKAVAKKIGIIKSSMDDSCSE